jgi:hypothetical protein
MFKNVNCVHAKNPDGLCKYLKVKRSLFGLGARLCVKYFDDDKECAYCEPFTRPPLAPPSGPSLNLVRRAEAVNLLERVYQDLGEGGKVKNDTYTDLCRFLSKE